MAGKPKPQRSPDAPAHLSDAAKIEWSRVTSDPATMADLGLSSLADAAIYCQAWARMAAAEQHVNDHGVIVPAARTGAPIVNPHLAIANRAAGVIQKVGRKTGGRASPPIGPGPVKPGPRLSQAEYAKRCGVSRAAVTKWKDAGRLVLVGDLVDVDASDALLEKYRRGGVNRLSTGTPNLLTIESGDSPETIAANILAASGVAWSMDEARRIKESYLALLNQLEYDRKSGAVVAVAEVAALVGVEYAKVRTKLLAIPTELAPQLLRLKTVTEVQDALHSMIVEALEALTRDGTRDGAAA